jgi:hypothetical protein
MSNSKGATDLEYGTIPCLSILARSEIWVFIDLLFPDTREVAPFDMSRLI